MIDPVGFSLAFFGGVLAWQAHRARRRQLQRYVPKPGPHDHPEKWVAWVKAGKPQEMPVRDFLAGDAAVGLPNEEMVRAVWAEYLAGDLTTEQLEAELDFYVLNKGEGAIREPKRRDDATVSYIESLKSVQTKFVKGAKHTKVLEHAEKHPCPVCEGTGLFTLEEPTCPQCGGTGVERLSDTRPTCGCADPVWLTVQQERTAICGKCGGAPPRARWPRPLDTGQSETR